MRIIVPGGSGHVGHALARALSRDKHEVVVLSRGQTAPPSTRLIHWDGRSPGEWCQAIDGADVVINLAGRSVDCRYHDRNRREIMDSRIDSTRAIGNAIAAATKPPRVWLNASTATIYRHALDRPMDEATGELGGNEPGAPEKWNFSIDVAKKWEEAFIACNTPGTRKVALRSAMTMSPDKGGIFDTLLGLVRKGLGGTCGSGRQYVSWVHEIDFANAVKFLIERDDMDGAVNIAAPNPLPNKDFMATLRRAWGMPIGLPAMEWMLEVGAVFLRTETELIMKSRRVISKRLVDAGFVFQYPEWQGAAEELCGRARQGIL